MSLAIQMRGFQWQQDQDAMASGRSQSGASTARNNLLGGSKTFPGIGTEVTPDQSSAPEVES